MAEKMMWTGGDTALLTDLYQLTMAQSYMAEGMNDEAVFELFFRKLPKSRNYLVFAGLDEVVTYLENFAFSPSDINYLASLGQFSSDFLERLAHLHFTGDLYAAREGQVVFADEPVLQVVAPLVEAQIVESFVLNLIHYQTLLASKASRVVQAAAGRDVVDFGMRRTHGGSAAMMAAKAGYIVGLSATSNVLAGKVYGIPVAGTMAHSYIQSHEEELTAFRDFARLYPETTLLVDTYDTYEGVRRVIELSKSLGDEFQVRAVRLDSGELVEQSRDVRRMLDEGGLRGVRIFASGDLDEYVISDLVAQRAPIDAFGVGTRLGVSQDAPSLDSAYKLVAYGGESRTKLSHSKTLMPGRKQVYRQRCADGTCCDYVAHWEEQAEGEPLLSLAMAGGKRAPGQRLDLEASRALAQEEVAALPLALRALDKAEPGYLVQISERLIEDFKRLEALRGQGVKRIRQWPRPDGSRRRHRFRGW